SNGSTGLYASHLPTVLKDEGSYGVIECHLASVPTQCALKSAIACSRLAHKLRSTSNFLAIST
ncbi:MAG: hypothetical protein WCD13_21290, partial [Pseudolabrys sp.]